MDMNFREVLQMAKAGDSIAIMQLVDFYNPLLKSNAMEAGIFNEGLYQELCIVLLKCIRKFEI